MTRTKQPKARARSRPERNDHAGLRPDAVPAEERIGDDRERRDATVIGMAL